jgi:hypothetical protein
MATNADPIISSVPMTANPYPGLRPFEVDDEPFFFGRRVQIDEVVQRLGANHLAAILGGSGCGKSSLILAGVLPELLTGGLGGSATTWIPIVFRPEEAPIGHFAYAFRNRLDGSSNDLPTLADLERLLMQRDALADLARVFHNYGRVDSTDVSLRQRANLLIVVDQFEEIFRPRNRASKQVVALVNLILDAFASPHPNVYVIMTMRSEDLHSCAGFIGLPEVLNECSYLVPRLRDSQLREVIVTPAERYAFSINQDLVFDDDVWAKIIEETLPLKDDPDHLPLLQHLLFHLWNSALHREEKSPGQAPKRITREDLEAASAPTQLTTKGDQLLAACLNNRAESIYSGLGGELQAVAKKMFTGMGVIDANGVVKRNFVSTAEFLSIAGASAQQVDSVTKPFLSPHTYLRVGAGGTWDVAHEAFIRKWKRFESWVLEDRERAQKFEGVYPEFNDWRKGLVAARANGFARLIKPWAGLLGWKDLQRLQASTKNPASIADVRRWMDRLDSVQSPRAAEEIHRDFGKYLTFSRCKLLLLIAVFAAVIGGPLWWVKDQMDGSLMRELALLPAVEGAVGETLGTLAAQEKPIDAQEHMTRLAEVTNSAMALRHLSATSGIILTRDARDMYLIAQGKAQAATLNSLMGVLSQYLWEANSTEKSPRLISTAQPKHPCAGPNNDGPNNGVVGDLYQSPDGTALLFDHGSIWAVDDSQDHGCKILSSLTSFPPDSMLRVDPGINVLVARMPASSPSPDTPARGWQWSIFLLRHETLSGHGHDVPTVVWPKTKAMSWDENESKFGDNWGVDYKPISDRVSEVVVSDGVHQQRYRHLREGLVLASENDTAEWDGPSDKWRVYEIASLPFEQCKLPFSHDGDQFCVSVFEENNQVRPGHAAYFIKLYIKASEHLQAAQTGEIAMIVDNEDKPERLAIGVGTEEGNFHIKTGRGAEFAGIWLSSPLESAGRKVLEDWAAKDCSKWNGITNHKKQSRYITLATLMSQIDERDLDKGTVDRKACQAQQTASVAGSQQTAVP